MLPGASAPPRFNGLMWSTTNPGHAPEVLPVAGQGWPARNALLAAGLRAIRPLAVRAQLPHLFVEDSECPTAERRSDRAADRTALRGAERGCCAWWKPSSGPPQAGGREPGPVFGST